MGIAHAQVVFPAHTGLPEDEVVTAWTYSGSGTALDVALAAEPILQTFHNSFAAYLSPALELGHVLSKWYKLSDTSATVVDHHPAGTGFGSPIMVSDWPLPAPGGTPLPNQVAICLSYHGVTHGLAEHSGPGPRPAQRLRGRVYLGPWGTPVLASTPSTHGPGVVTSIAEAICAAAEVMMTALPLTADWSIWSRKNEQVYSIVGGFMDDRFDIQRRRAEKATSRTLFGIAGT